MFDFNEDKLTYEQPLEGDFNTEDYDNIGEEMTIKAIIKAIDEQIEELKRKKKYLLTGK